MIKLRQIFQATGTALAISSLLSFPANAGYNGQQLAITTNATATQIRVTGKNQRGQTVTWTQGASGSGGSLRNITLPTNNWWWVGTVTISISRSTGENLQCSKNVPTILPGSDLFPVNCGATLLPR